MYIDGLVSDSSGLVMEVLQSCTKPVISDFELKKEISYASQGSYEIAWMWVPSGLWYKMHFSRQLNYWSLRCSWSIACLRCSNYIFILHLTLGFNILCKDSCKPRQETFECWDLVPLILEKSGNVMGRLHSMILWYWCSANLQYSPPKETWPCYTTMLSAVQQNLQIIF